MTEIEDIPTAYSRTLVEIGEAFPDVIVLDADLADSCKTEAFNEAFPERTFDLGVAEQSLPTFAAGLALVGKIPIYNTFAVFAVHRGFDMVRQSIAYNQANVKIVGHAAGQAMGYAGPSHHTLEDLAAVRALPGFVILCPGDAVETRQMMHWMVQHQGPVYLRLSRAKVPPFYGPDEAFEVGRTLCVREGRDLSIYSCSDLITLALEAHEQLAQHGVSAQVVHVSTLKPLPAEEILRHAVRTRAAISLEDHSIYGGLGSAVAEIYAEHLDAPVKRMGIRDTFTESDDCDVLRASYGLSMDDISLAAEALLQ
jgi:transketolase